MWRSQFLWWATRLTFNSYRIYRHMFRLLAVSGDPELAKRTLRLYVQVVAKAREAGASQGGTNADVEGPVDTDTDRQWVQTLVLGAKMFCRFTVQEADHGRAVELAKEAGTIIQKAKARLEEEDKELVASVQLAEGIWHSVMAFTGAWRARLLVVLTDVVRRARPPHAQHQTRPLPRALHSRSRYLPHSLCTPPPRARPLPSGAL